MTLIFTDNDLTAIAEGTDKFKVPFLLATLATTVRSINAENGWETPTWEKLPTKLMLIVTETDEAVQGHKGVGKDPVEEEIADVWIRTADVIVSLKQDTTASFAQSWEPRVDLVALVNTIRTTSAELTPPKGAQDAFEVTMWPFISLMTKTMESWRDDQKRAANIFLEDTLYECHTTALERGHDLIPSIAKKLLKNRKRARLHGRARADG